MSSLPTVTVYLSADDTPVVEINTAGVYEIDGQPCIRVFINKGEVYGPLELSPPLAYVSSVDKP